MRLDYLHIGMAKSASTWLYRTYLEHPEIFAPPESDNPNFFLSHYHLGLGWYERQYFSTVQAETAVGEFSNSYLISGIALERIAQTFPDIRLTCILRNPVERAYLHWAHLAYKGKRFAETDSGDPLGDAARPVRPFRIPLEAVQHPNGWVYCRMFLEPGLYAFHLNRLLRLFPRDRLHIALYDDLRRDPEGFLAEIFSFLEVDAEFRPDCLHTEINRDAPEADPEEMSEELREHIRAFYAEDLARLEGMLDRDLSGWR